MIWNRKKSILVTQILVGLLAAALLTMDIFGWKLCGYIVKKSLFLEGTDNAFLLLMMTLYSCSAFTALILVRMMQLLVNLRRDRVFVRKNVKLLKRISRSFLVITVICVCSAGYFIPSVAVAAAAAFLGAVVQVVKNVFESAIAMKDELDLTV